MKNPNYENTVGKHPIPHAKGIAKGETSEIEKQKKNKSKDKSNRKEEEE